MKEITREFVSLLCGIMATILILSFIYKNINQTLHLPVDILFILIFCFFTLFFKWLLTDDNKDLYNK